MKTITLEEHFTTPLYLEAIKGLEPDAPANSRMQVIQQKQTDLGDGRLADMDASGIDVQVLSLSGILLDALDQGAICERIDINYFLALHLNVPLLFHHS